MNWLKRNCCDGIYDSSIDIRFTKLCDNRCSFCIEDMEGIPAFSKTNVDRLIKSVNVSVEMDGKDTVLILGGEPFMFPKALAAFVKGIRETVKSIYITTSLPREVNLADPYVAYVLGEVDGINVSLHHYDSDKNNEVLKSRRPYNRIQALSDIAFWYGHKIRVQTNLVKGGIDNADSIRCLVQLLEAVGVAELKLNELQGVGEDLYVSFDELYSKSLGQPYSEGCVSDISDLFEDHSMVITVKRTCFIVQPHSPHGANWLDVLKFVIKKFKRKPINRGSVIYENGLRSSGWIKKDTLIHREKVD